MASENVAHDEATPGWRELLTPEGEGINLGLAAGDAAKFRRLAQAAENVQSMIQGGLAAIGELQWRAAAYDSPGGLPTDVVFRTGVLVGTLGDLVAMLTDYRENAGHCVREIEAGRCTHA